MDQRTLMTKISRFWDWFQQSEHMYRELTDPQAAVEAMDNYVLEFGMFSWEIGEGKSKPHYLMISPNGDGKRLDISCKLMEAAPNLKNWEFHYCKPPKDWDFKLEVHDKFLVKQLVDASEWEYILLPMPDNYVEVVIQANNMEDVDMEDKLNAAEIALTNLLGEELVINHLCALEVVSELKPELEKRCHKLGTLRRDFLQLIRRN